MKFEDYALTGIHTALSEQRLDGVSVVKVVKSGKSMRFDENTYARIDETLFHNGVIEADMLSRLLPDAPDFARGFIGVAFRIDRMDSEFEAYYVRPTNGRSDDPVRRMHGSQYFAYPGYTFSYFREHGITQYEAPADIGLNEWIHIKAVIQDEAAAFFVNDMERPALCVGKLKHGVGIKGGIGLFVDEGTEGFFKNITITCDD